MAELDTVECPADRLEAAISLTRINAGQGLAQVERLISDFPQDARLHFLRGSLLAGEQRYGEAHDAMATAVDIAPGYELARFQLGFLEFTSGDAASASSTWAPLKALAEQNPLRLFVEGLERLAVDDFKNAARLLRDGMALNQLAPMNRDMQLILDKIEETQTNADDQAVSAAHLLLQQYADRSTRH